MHTKLKNISKTIAAAILSAGLLFQTVPAWALPSSSETVESLATHFGKDVPSLLTDGETLIAGDSVSDWTAFVTARSGNLSECGDYLSQLEEYVTNAYKQNGCLDPSSATTWHRIIMTVIALGENPTAFGKDADGNSVNLIADGCYNFSAAESFDVQGLNAWLYALLALDSYCFKVPEGSAYTRETILQKLVSSQEEDGGFGLVKGSSDVDLTAMVLQALAPYQNSSITYYDSTTAPVTIPDVIDKALNYLSAQQQDDGGYLSGDISNSESCSQVIVGLCSLGINPAADERFAKNGKTVVDALETFRLDDGTYSHDSDMVSDGMASQQAAFAENALERLANGERRLFDLRTDALDGALAMEAELQGLTDEDIAAQLSSLMDEYNAINPEDRSYVHSFSRVRAASAAQGQAVDEDTSTYYELNTEVPVTAEGGTASEKSSSHTGMIIGAVVVLAGAGAGCGIALAAKKKKSEKKDSDKNK